MNPKNVFHAKTSPILVVICVLVVGAVTWFWTKPTITTVRAARAESQENRRLTQEAEAQVERLTKLKSGIESTRGAAAELNLAFPRDSQLPEVLVQLEVIAAESQMKINSLSVDTAPKPGGVPISISTSGTFEQLQSFLALIESSRRPIIVQSISLSGGAEGNLTTTFTLEMLYQGAGTEEAGAGSGSATPVATPNVKETP